MIVFSIIQILSFLFFIPYPRENGDDSSHGTLTSVKTTLMQVGAQDVSHKHNTQNTVVLKLFLCILTTFVLTNNFPSSKQPLYFPHRYLDSLSPIRRMCRLCCACCVWCIVSLDEQEWDGLRTTKDRVVVIASTNRYLP